MTETDTFPVITQLLDAGSHQERALQLLRLPDALVMSHGADIIAACRGVQFDAGAAFLLYRSTGLNLVRDAHGMLPEAQARELEAWRVAMSELVAGKGDGIPRW